MNCQRCANVFAIMCEYMQEYAMIISAKVPV